MEEAYSVGRIVDLDDLVFALAGGERHAAQVADRRAAQRAGEGRVPADPARAGDFQGLLGSYTHSTADDFALRDGTVLTQPLSFHTLYHEYADSWRISQAESQFHYGSGQTTDTFTDQTFPPHAPTLDDFAQNLVDAARELAREHGLPDGDNRIWRVGYAHASGNRADYLFVNSHRGYLPQAIGLGVRAPRRIQGLAQASFALVRHQGWRYLEDQDAPIDLGDGAEGAAALPPALIGRLAELGLI